MEGGIKGHKVITDKGEIIATVLLFLFFYDFISVMENIACGLREGPALAPRGYLFAC